MKNKKKVIRKQKISIELVTYEGGDMISIRVKQKDLQNIEALGLLDYAKQRIYKRFQELK